LNVVRRKSIPVNVGGVVIGGAAPIAVQTMTKTDTRDVKATLRQIHEQVRKSVERDRQAQKMQNELAQKPSRWRRFVHYVWGRSGRR